MNRFFAAFTLLTLITILLLGYTVLFFTSESVRMQIGAWVNQLPPPAESISRLAVTGPTPIPTFTSLPTQPPTLEPTLTMPETVVAEEQGTVEATPQPMVWVIDEPFPDGSLVIPSLGIDERVVTVPVLYDAWDLATLGPQIGWLQTTGSRPRDDLAMVFVGHITLPYPGGFGPFLNLSALEPGDVVGYRSGEETYIYEVTGQSIVQPDQVDRLYVPDGKRLLLVTCTGYNAIEMRYDLRLIVEAELVSIEK